MSTPGPASTGDRRHPGDRLDRGEEHGPHREISTGTADRILQWVFIVGYACWFPLHLVRFLLPEGHRSDSSIVAYAVLAAIGVYAWRTQLAARARQIAAHKRHALLVLSAAIPAVFAAELLGALAHQLLSQIVPHGAQTLQNDENIAAYLQRYPAFVVIATAGIVGPLVEELFFRQFLIPFLSRFTATWVAVVISSVLFGMLHMHSLAPSEWVGVIPHAFFGLAAGVLFVRSGNNLYLPATIHVLFNLSGLLPNL